VADAQEVGIILSAAAALEGSEGLVEEILSDPMEAEEDNIPYAEMPLRRQGSQL
jgi:hypothetical protein